MGTKTIGIREEAYERLKARKREDESFTDLVERLLEASRPDWREGFGTLSNAEMEALEAAVARSRARTGEGLGDRQHEALERMAEVSGDDDETA